MHCLQIFFLSSIIISIHAQSLHNKSYQERSLHLNKSIHIIDIIKNHLLWPSASDGAKDEFNWRVRYFNAYLKRKWEEESSQNRRDKKKGLISSKLEQHSLQNQNSVQSQISGNLPCKIPKWVNQKEIGKSLSIFYSNPCQPDPERPCKFIYKNFISRRKFIQCDKSGKALIKSCPKYSKWDNKLRKCSYSFIVLNTSCSIPSWVNQKETGSELPSFYVNPCPRDDKLRKCDFLYLRYKLKSTKFIQCDRSGNAIIKSCPPSSKWDKIYKQCSLKTTTLRASTEEYQDPTTAGGTVEATATSTEEYQGSTTAGGTVETTATSTEEYQEPTTAGGTVEATATSTGEYTESSIGETSIPSTATITRDSCSIPSWVNQKETGSKLPSFYVNPCPRDDKLRKCDFLYLRYKLKSTKFIQCDRSGNAIIKSCPPSSKWDKVYKQCSLKTTTLRASTEEYQDPTTVGGTVEATATSTEEYQGSTTAGGTVEATATSTEEYQDSTTAGGTVEATATSTEEYQDSTTAGGTVEATATSTEEYQGSTTAGGTVEATVTSTDQYQDSTIAVYTNSNLNITNKTEPPCSIPNWDDKTDNGSKLPGFYQNPCKQQPNGHCKFTYKEYEVDETKFIQCDRSGNARLKSCPISFKWDNSVEQCLPTTTTTTAGGTVEATSTSTEQYQDSTIAVYTNSNLNITNKTEPPCSIPNWDDKTNNGTKLPGFYQNPCKQQPNGHCKFTYKEYEVDETKFIQCDRSGNARLKSCPISFKWDNSVEQCLPTTTTTTAGGTVEATSTSTEQYQDSTIAVYTNSNLNITNKTEPPCSIPNWDDKTNNGTKLPGFYQNPCKQQPNGHCKFTYKEYEVDETKFIQCDRSGNARLKSCPISFKWDNSVEQCLPTTTTTTAGGTVEATSTSTEQYQDSTIAVYTNSNLNITNKTEPPCSIPNWDDKTNNGTELPGFYQNPCKQQPNGHCKFTYKEYEVDETKFIQCDRSGNARLKSCPISFKWDNSVEQCIATTTPTTAGGTVEATSTSTEQYQDSTIAVYTNSNLNITNKTEPPCSIPNWDDKTNNGTKLPGFYKNPCKQQPNGHCKFTYKEYKVDETKFIQCDRSGNARLKSCPISFKWDNSVEQCLPTTTTTTAGGTVEATSTSTEQYQDSTIAVYTNSNLNITNKTEHPCSIPNWDDKTNNGSKLPGFYQNPCKQQPNGHCKFTYKEYEVDETKFIQCDRSGNARLKSCPISFKWDNSVEQCSSEVVSTTELPCPIPAGVDQTQKASTLPLVYPNPCTADPSRTCAFSFMPFLLVPQKFIQCDRFGEASVKSCQQSFVWFQNVQQCLPQIITTSPPPPPQCQIPVWDSQNEQGSTLPPYYPNPCIADLNRVCLFVYESFLLDEHKFILCNKNGNALIKTCPSNSKWIADARKCSEPQCEIPAWVDEKEKGIPLEPLYPNPCPVDEDRNCQFIYLLYMLDQYKFIQCDKSGNAIIKSCPPSSIWDDHIHQCSIMTTLRPACAIPKWMNQNDKGLPLSSNLPNPCKETTLQTCKYFTYLLNDQHFIECDEYGEAWVKTCPPKSKWNNTFNKCTA